METDIVSQAVGLGGNTDFSLWKLFLRADFVVKSVIIILIISSIWSWALIFDKYKLFKKINKSAEDFENKFWKAKSAESFNNTLPSKSIDPIILIFRDAMNELIKTKSKSSSVQLARVERVFFDWHAFQTAHTTLRRDRRQFQFFAMNATNILYPACVAIE